MLTFNRCAMGVTATLVTLLTALPAGSEPTKLECALALADTRNTLGTLSRLNKSLDAAAALKGEELDGELKAAVEELEAKKGGLAIAINELTQATRNLAGVLERCAKGQ